MADYYTSFSLVLELPSEEAQEYALKVASTMSDAGRDDTGKEDKIPDFVLPFVKDEMENWVFDTEASGECDIWLSSEFGGLDAAIVFIQHLLQKFMSNGVVVLEWANSCSKPRTDAYGGGAAVITAEVVKSMGTFGWSQDLLLTPEFKKYVQKNS